MQEQDPAIMNQYQRNFDSRLAGQINNRTSPQNRISYSPGHWKKYIPSDSNLRSPQKKQIGVSNNYKSSNFDEDQLSGQHIVSSRNKLAENQVNKLQQQKRRKQQMIKRVEQIQKRVMPILKSQRNSQQIDQNFGWMNRMEQRILKIQTNVDCIEKQLQIKFEKRILEIQRQWSTKMQALIRSHSQNNERKRNKIMNPTPPKMYQNIKTFKSELNKNRGQYEDQTRKYVLQKDQEKLQNKNQPREDQEEDQNEIQNSQGYFTKRQNKNNKTKNQIQNM